MKDTIRITGSPYLHYDDPQPAPAPLWQRAAWALADHLAVTALRGTIVLVAGEILLPLRGGLL